MKRFEHGGDIYTHPGVVDFSASLNPLGMPTAAREALLASVDACELYPDPYARELVRALADFEHVDAAWVVPCAGATDAIERLCQVVRPRQALVFACGIDNKTFIGSKACRNEREKNNNGQYRCGN